MTKWLNNHIELPEHHIGLLLVPKAGASSVRRSVEASNAAYRASLATVRSDYHRIAVVRNTYDRLVSCWAQKCNEHFPEKVVQLGEAPFYTGMPFSEFLDVVAQDPRANHHYYPQDEIVGEYDEVWFLPELNDRWHARIPDIQLHHLNANPHRAPGWREQFGESDVRLVQDLYRNEILRWEFEL